MKIGSKKYRIRRRGRRVKIFFQRKWRPCRKTRGKWYVNIRGWRPVIRRRGKWYTRLKRRLMRIRRKAKLLLVKLLGMWRRMKMLRRRLYIRLGRKYKRVKRCRKYYINYHGRRLGVKWRRKKVAVHRRGGKWTRYRRPRRTRKL